MKDNKLIAEFMGFKKCQSPEISECYWVKKSTYYHPDMMKYHTSWDWIVPVIQKWRDLDMDNDNYRSLTQNIDDAVTDAYDINQVHTALILAITWYNTQPHA